MYLTFDAAHVARLIAVSEAAAERRPNFLQAASPGYLREDIPVARRLEIMTNVDGEGLCDSIAPEEIDSGKIPAGIWLVGDQGVYIMSNEAGDAAKSIEGGHVAYAREANPKTLDFDEWWSAKRESFGPDDGVDFLPVDFLKEHLSGPDLVLDVSAEGISVVGPGPDPAAPVQ